MSSVHTPRGRGVGRGPRDMFLVCEISVDFIHRRVVGRRDAVPVPRQRGDLARALSVLTTGALNIPNLKIPPFFSNVGQNFNYKANIN